MKKLIFLLAMLMLTLSWLTGCTRSATPTEQQTADSSPTTAAADAPLEYTLEEIKYLFLTIIPQAYEVYWWYYGGQAELQNSFVYVTADYQKLQQMQTIAELKAASEAIFSSEFCENALYPQGFTADANGRTRFQEVNGLLQIDYGPEHVTYFMDCYNYLCNDGLADEQIKHNSPDKIVVELICTDYDLASKLYVDFRQDFTLILEDDVWKLANWPDLNDAVD